MAARKISPSTKPSVYAIGLMSGTSCDGIDAALVKTDGVVVDVLGESTFTPYAPDLRKQLIEAVHTGKATDALERELTFAHIAVVKELLSKASLSAQDIALVGFPGQTIFHDPANGITQQIGDAALLAKELGIDAIGDFRSNDVKQGGEGAPLVPVFHRALFEGYDLPLAVVNIGGVANVTYLDEDAMIAFDTGPGNALLDDWMQKHTGNTYDDGGEVAFSQQTDGAFVEQFLAQSYFSRRPPKSLDRNQFYKSLQPMLESDTGLSTLTQCTVASIVASQKHFPKAVKRWFVAGGGRHNQALLSRLQEALSVAVDPIEAAGFNGDMLEAQAFAYLAVRSHYGLPLTFPDTTGVKEATLGGVFCPASRA
jgi:anhydro-N-acetylmuramic acid kinase